MLENIFTIFLGLLLFLLILAVYFCPAIIAFKRRHAFKYVILGINIIGFVGILPWIIAFIWSVWPSDKSLLDPIAGNVTGKGKRNVGDTLGSVQYGVERGYQDERNS